METSSLTSVVVSAYNGACYIRDQLDSLAFQERRIDELIVVDDASTDDTAALIQDFLVASRQPGWRLVQRERNQGWERNFRDLITQSTAAFIFPCDQDDMWDSRKVECMVRVMEARPDIDVLACSVEPIYEEGSTRTAADTCEREGSLFDAVRLCEFSEKSLYVGRPGCTYCIRQSFVDEIKPYWNSSWPHDAFLWRMAGVKGSLALLDKKLVRFRRHGNNASNRVAVDAASRLEDVKYYLDMLDALKRYAAVLPDVRSETVDFLVQMESWFEARSAFLSSGGSLTSLAAMAKGRKFYATSKGLAVDVAVGVGHLRFA